MELEDYIEFAVPMLVHIGEQLNAIRKALEPERSHAHVHGPGSHVVTAITTHDPLSEELGRLAGQALHLLGKAPDQSHG